MRSARSILLALLCLAAVATAVPPAHAETGATLQFTTDGGGSAAVTPSVGDPIQLVGTLAGSIGATPIEPGTCTLSLEPSTTPGSGSGRLGDCASSDVAFTFDYVNDPTGQTFASTAVHATGNPTPAAVWRIDCWLSWPPFRAGCKITSSVA